MANILHINASYKPAYVYGGPTISVSNLCEELAKSNTVEVYTTTANGKSELSVQTGVKLLMDGVAVTFFSRLSKDHTHFSPALILHYIQNIRKFDIIHVHAWWNTVSVLCLILGVLLGKTLIFSPRGTLSPYSFRSKNDFIKRLIFNIGKPFLNRCHFHVTSELEEQHTLKLLTPKSIHIIPNLIQLPEQKSKMKPVFIPGMEEKPGTFKLFFISRIDEKKGLELLFSSLRYVNYDWQLSIAGNGEKGYVDKLVRLSKEYKIEEHISWIGFLDNQVKFKLMKEQDLLVLPSYDENFANIVIECLSTGTPVLLSENVGLSRFVEQHNLGWAFKRTEEELIKHLNKMSGLRMELMEIRKRSPEVISDLFKPEILIKDYLKMYFSVSGRLS